MEEKNFVTEENDSEHTNAESAIKVEKDPRK